MKMWIMNLGKPVTVPTLNETMAIELGANLLGEGIIFIIAAGILYAEYARQVRKETAKEAARQEEISTLTYTIQELYFQAERQDAQIRELLRTVTDLESKVVKVPWKSSSKDQPPPDPPQQIEPDNMQINKFNTPVLTTNVWPEQKGIILTAVSYLANDVFSENNYKYR